MLNAAGARVAIGLHLTLTGAVQAADAGYAPLRDGAFLPLTDHACGSPCSSASTWRRSRAEMRAQFKAFVKAFGRPPDFVDGHQHVHLFPQVRQPRSRRSRWMAPHAWVRQCGSIRPLRAAAVRSEGPAARLAQPRIPRPRGAPRRRHQSGVCRHLYLPAATRISPRIFPEFLEGLPRGRAGDVPSGPCRCRTERLDPLTAAAREANTPISPATRFRPSSRRTASR